MRTLRQSVRAASLVFMALAGSLPAQAQGNAWAWGDNDTGRLGNGTTTWSSVPIQMTVVSGVVGVAAGYNHSLVVKSDGTVWACGSNQYGQLGIGSSDNNSHSAPVQVTGLTGVVAVAGGAYHSVALKSNGTVWAWGNNVSGQLGNNTTADSSVPVQVKDFHGVVLSGVVAVAGGNTHSLALKVDGTVWAWGSGGNGELGNGNSGISANSSEAVQVKGLSGVVGVAAGDSLSLAVTKDGKAWAWGWNREGQLGNGTIGDANSSSLPVQVTGLSGVVGVAAGYYHGLAFKSDGTAWAWGLGGYGQLGNGTNAGSTVPVQVTGLSDVVAMAGGVYHSLAVKSDGTVWDWGANFTNQLGDGTGANRSVPVQTIGLSGIQGVAGGFGHSLACEQIIGTTATTLSLSAAAGQIGKTATLTATLKNKATSARLAFKSVQFYVDGAPVGIPQRTNAGGAATYVFAVPEGMAIGSHATSAAFGGDWLYASANATSTLTASKGPVKLSVVNASGKAGASVTLSAKLTNGGGAAVVGQIISFSVDGNPAGSRTTSATGQAAASYLIPDALTIGTHTIAAEFAGNSNYLSGSGSAILTVKPPTYSTFTLTPNPVKGGNNVTGKVTMTGPVAADTTVTLTNANTKAHLPGATVTIPAGSASVSFTMTTDATTVSVSGAVKATVGSVSKSVTLKVTP